MTPLVLIAEHDAALAEGLRIRLQFGGYRVTLAGDGEEALLSIEAEEPDLVILDRMLPHVSAIEVCRRIRRQKRARYLPVFVLSPLRDEFDLARTLDSGADDYLAGSISPVELMARMRAHLRRTNPALVAKELRYDGVTIDIRKRKAGRNGRSVHLTPAEFRLLATLLEQPGQAYSRDMLFNRVKGEDSECDLRNIDMLISRVRRALTAEGEANIIKTIRGVGYTIEEERVEDG